MGFSDSVLICDVVDPILNKILTDNGLKISYEPEITPEQILEKFLVLILSLLEVEPLSQKK